MDLNKKILILSTGDTHGAYEAMYKISQILITMSYDVTMLVQHKTKSDFFIKQYISPTKKKTFHHYIINYLNRFLGKKKTSPRLVTNSKYLFLSQDESKESIDSEHLLQSICFKPDFIFTGITHGFLNSTDLKKLAINTGAKVFNIAVDMVHFTGGCHYAWDCKGYQHDCSGCPAIQTEELKHIAADNLKIKKANATAGNFEIINMSEWTREQALSSTIYKDKAKIPNINSIIDTALLNNKKRAVAKKVFDLEKDKFHIMAGSYQSTDPRKGFTHFVEALNIISKKITPEQYDKIRVIIASQQIVKELEELPFKTIYIDYIKDYRLLSLLYQATDVFVCSSVEDAGPMMVSEAMACGTPVVAFEMGIANNMVKNGENGYLAKLEDNQDLAQGIMSIFELSPEEYENYSKKCVLQIEEYSSYEYVKKVFKEILN